MSKIAREIAEGIEETLIAGNHSKHASYVLGVIPKSELEEFVDTKLAPTLALMERLVELVEMFHPAGDTVPHKDCDPCQALADYKAWKKEQG